MDIKIVSLLLFIGSICCHCNSQAVVNIVPGMFSKATVSNGLNLQATSTFKPITSLTTNVHFDKCYAVFVHYQITFETVNADFQSKLMINYDNAGSLVHSGKQVYKTATGFYMANLNPGYYNIEVYYKSPVAISMPTSRDWQTAILQVVWAEDAYAVSDSIKCYPTPTPTNNYNNWGPIRDTEVALQLPNDRVVMSAYQFSAEMVAPSNVFTALEVNGFHYHTTVIMKGNNDFLDLHGAGARQLYTGVHYFNMLYSTPTKFSFTDCIENYKNNKNLYAMMLPPSCNVATINPKNSFRLSNSNSWAPTDLTHSFTLSKQSHVIIMYQYAGFSGNSHTIMRLSIDSIPQKHTVSLTGNTKYAGNFGLWQGALNPGGHKVSLDYRAAAKTVNTVSAEIQWKRWNKWQNRAMTIVYC